MAEHIIKMKKFFSLNQRERRIRFIWPGLLALSCLSPASAFSQLPGERTGEPRISRDLGMIKQYAVQAAANPVATESEHTPVMLLALAEAPKAHGAEAPANGDQAPTYLRDIQPIFMGKCSRCHNSQARFVYDWLDYRTAYKDRWELKRRIWDSWKGTYYKESMPISNSPESMAITEEERLTIKNWVLSGARVGVAPLAGPEKSKSEKIELGRKLFTSICAACHQPAGQGVPNVFPPLAGSDYLNADKNRAIKIVINGRQGEVAVNGTKFNNSMPAFPLDDQDIANVLTFVYNSFGNSGLEVKTEEVKALRAEAPDVAPTGPKPPANPFD
jgi:mono/diheme cytochrome c family protein